MAAFPFDLTVIVRRQEAAASMANVSHRAVKYQVNREGLFHSLHSHYRRESEHNWFCWVKQQQQLTGDQTVTPAPSSGLQLLIRSISLPDDSEN